MELDDYIHTDDCGERFVKGHRVPILSVLREHIDRGKDGRQLAEQFDTLSLDKIYAVLAYYYVNQEEVDRYLQEAEAKIERQRHEYFKNYKGPTHEELVERIRNKKGQQAREPDPVR